MLPLPKSCLVPVRFLGNPLRAIYQYLLRFCSFSDWGKSAQVKHAIGLTNGFTEFERYFAYISGRTHVLWWMVLAVGSIIFLASRLHIGLRQKVHRFLAWISYWLRCYYEYYQYVGYFKLFIFFDVIFRIGWMAQRFCALHEKESTGLLSTAMQVFYGMLSLLEGITYVTRSVLSIWLAFVVRAYLLHWMWGAHRKNLRGTANKRATASAFAWAFFCISFCVEWLDPERVVALKSFRLSGFGTCYRFLRQFSYGYLLNRLWQKEIQNYPTVRLNHSIASCQSLMRWLKSCKTRDFLSQLGIFGLTGSDQKGAWQLFLSTPTTEALQNFQKTFQTSALDFLRRHYRHLEESAIIEPPCAHLSEKSMTLSECGVLKRSTSIPKDDQKAPNLIQLIRLLRCTEFQNRLLTLQQDQATHLQPMKADPERFAAMIAQVLEQEVAARSLDLSKHLTLVKAGGYEKPEEATTGLQDEANHAEGDFGFLTLSAFFQAMVPFALFKSLFVPG